MSSRCTVAVALMLSGLVACAGPDANPAGDPGPSGSSFAGQWCGLAVSTAAECVGDEAGFLELAQSGSSVSGIACEAFAADCIEIQDVVVSGSTLGFRYSWFEEGTTYTVSASLQLSAAGDQLSGTYHSTKCDCDMPVTFERV